MSAEQHLEQLDADDILDLAVRALGGMSGLLLGDLTIDECRSQWARWGIEAAELTVAGLRIRALAEEMQDGERRCRICGCGEYSACDGGCWWVDEDLCSAHAPETITVRDELL